MPHHRSIRAAAQKAEDVVGAIVKQEEETRDELLRIARQKERSGHIDRLPSQIATLRLGFEKGAQLLRRLAAADPDAAAAIRPFEILKFHNEAAKQRFRALAARPISFKRIYRPPQVENRENMVTAGMDRKLNSSVVVDDTESSNTNRSSKLTPLPANLHTRDASLVVTDADEFWRNRHYLSSSALAPAAFASEAVANFTLLHGQLQHHSPVQQVINVPSRTNCVNSSLSQPHLNTENENDRYRSGLQVGSDFMLDKQPLPSFAHDFSTQNVLAHGSSGRNYTMTRSSLLYSKPTVLPLDHASKTVEKDAKEELCSFNFMQLPPRDLPEHISYRVGIQTNQRLMKFQKPPNGWEGSIRSVSGTDFSDPRYWAAPSPEEQEYIWKALQPTLKEYSDITNESLARRQVALLPYGYMPSYSLIRIHFSRWCFARLKSNHEWIIGGKVVHNLFMLERWYGLLGDYVFSPNWPIRLRDSHQRIVQNPDCFACDECISLDIFCHGHREDYNARCRPCKDNGRECSKRLY